MNSFRALNNDKLLVVGSLNWNSADREVERSDLQTVQVLSNKGFEPIFFFDAWGELGVSSFSADPENRFRWFASTGNDLVEIDLLNGTITSHFVNRLDDVHEMDFINGHLWISNTGRNEVVVYDVNNRCTVDRFLLNNGGKSNYRNSDIEAEDIAHYHVNQIFTDMAGEPCVLVHNTTGRQFFKRAAGKFIKSQGAGGIIELESRRVAKLNLKAPHNVRIVGDEYWICNSGHMLVSRFDANWKNVGEFPTKGFGRGVALNLQDNRIYIGTSKTRKRYLGMFPKGEEVPNLIQAFSIGDQSLEYEVLVPNVEQVSNIYILDDRQYELFKELRPFRPQ